MFSSGLSTSIIRLDNKCNLVGEVWSLLSFMVARHWTRGSKPDGYFTQGEEVKVLDSMNDSCNTRITENCNSMGSVRLRSTGSWGRSTNGCSRPSTCVRHYSRGSQASSAPSRPWRKARCTLQRTKPLWTNASAFSSKESMSCLALSIPWLDTTIRDHLFSFLFGPQTIPYRRLSI